MSSPSYLEYFSAEGSCAQAGRKSFSRSNSFSGAVLISSPQAPTSTLGKWFSNSMEWLGSDCKCGVNPAAMPSGMADSEIGSMSQMDLPDDVPNHNVWHLP